MSSSSDFVSGMLAAEFLRPFRSFIFVHLTDPTQDEEWADPLVRSIVDYIQGSPPFEEYDQTGTMASLVRVQDREGINSGGAVFKIEEPPAWDVAGQFMEIRYALVVVCQLDRVAAIHTSDPRVKDALISAIRNSSHGFFGKIDLFDQGIMNAAFAKGRARTLWLSGTHRRTAIKSDSKVLSGVDLTSAIDPLGDQSYHFTAARFFSGEIGILGSIGFNPTESTAWISKSRNWKDFLDTTGAILLHLACVSEPNYAPIPMLAAPLTNADNVHGAFDLNVTPPELDPDGAQIPVGERETRDLWAYQSHFEVDHSDGTDFTANIYLRGEHIGELVVTCDMSDPRDVLISTDVNTSIPGHGVQASELRSMIQNRRWLTVRYESGHTLSGNRLYQTRFRDVEFISTRWDNFTGFNITQEKPTTWDQLGSGNSLFCWIWTHWPMSVGTAGRGWLACDDAANEMADFVHVDPVEKVITLIHVKASGTESSNRQVSVSKFEVVVSQAVKNLRFLDQEHLTKGLADGLNRQVGNLVLHDGMASSREAMMEMLAGAGASFSRQVVIVQPHLHEEQWKQAAATPDSANGRRLRQLRTLLVEAESACHAVGARFMVIGEASPIPAAPAGVVPLNGIVIAKPATPA